MKLSAYLSLSRHGVFYFRWPLPRKDHDSRPCIRISLRTRCPYRAGTLDRYLASCREITRDNKELARLRQDKLRELVRGYFHAQLDQYIEWINKRGLSPMALEDARSEMLDHEADLEHELLNLCYLPVKRFKRKMDISDEDWFDSLPHAITELRKGRRDMLRAVLEAAEGFDSYSYTDMPAATVLPPCLPQRHSDVPLMTSWMSIPANGPERLQNKTGRISTSFWNTSGRIAYWARSPNKMLVT